MEILQHLPGKTDDVNIVIQSKLKAFSTDKEQLIKEGIQYIKKKFAAIANNSSLVTLEIDTFWWPSATDALQQFGNSKIEGTTTHLTKMLIGARKGEKMPNYIIGE